MNNPNRSYPLLSMGALLLSLTLMGVLGGVKPAAAPLYRAHLPLIQNGDALPPLAIYDLEGNLRDWDWLVANFGDVRLTQGSDATRVTELHAVEGPATLLVDVGQPGVSVFFSWPDAPLLPPQYWNCGQTRGLHTHTEQNGKAALGMGGGSYYFPPAGGPHCAWLGANSSCVCGLGMVGLTNHRHLDSVWR